LACRSEGPGRLPDPEDILERATVLLSEQDLAGVAILVTAGPTVEPMDPVRYLSNRSSGKMGYAIARAARRRGASVTLVSGPTSLKPPYGVRLISVKTAEEMQKAVFENWTNCSAVIKAAAVSDYRPKETATQKIKKQGNTLSLELVKNPDILAELGRTKEEFGCSLVGFAAETRDLLTHAEEKLKAKNLDMIVANDVSRDDAGFQSDTNMVKIICANGHIEETPLLTKDEVADLVLSRIKTMREDRLEP
jgi:phosphopantothenoylcysteine decarboxylase/phosphopantothenate--cysteine ligase